jgi:hypothetical protein
MPKERIVLVTVDEPASGKFTTRVEKTSGETTF